MAEPGLPSSFDIQVMRCAQLKEGYMPVNMYDWKPKQLFASHNVQFVAMHSLEIVLP